MQMPGVSVWCTTRHAYARTVGTHIDALLGLAVNTWLARHVASTLSTTALWQVRENTRARGLERRGGGGGRPLALQGTAQRASAHYLHLDRACHVLSKRSLARSDMTLTLTTTGPHPLLQRVLSRTHLPL